jgi:hypothetical protein
MISIRMALMSLATAALVIVCDRTPSLPGATRPASTGARPIRVDSAVPREVALARFQEKSERVSGFAGGATSRDGLVRAFIRAVEAGDSAALRRMVLSRSEFAYLYYPTSAQGLPPYSLSPDLYWFMIVERSNRGASALLVELGRRPLHFAGYQCEGDSTREGDNTLWGPCLVRSVEGPGDTLSRRLFGPIVAHKGRYKFLSYSNKL